MKTICDVMTVSAHTIGKDQPLKTAQDMMEKYTIRHLPVQHGGKLVGILSLRDVQRAVGYGDDTAIEDIMTQEPYIVPPETPLKDVVQTMAKRRLSSVIVVENGATQGIFTEIDALKMLESFL